LGSSFAIGISLKLGSLKVTTSIAHKYPWHLLLIPKSLQSGAD